VLLILIQSFETVALVVSAPGLPIDTLVDTAPREHVKTATPPLLLRVRSTKEDDLNEISSLLASANINSADSDWNWKTSMEVLRNKSALKSLLSSRHGAMKEGERAAKCVPLDDAINDKDRMRLLWAHDSFRRKLEKAATLAKEPHVWKEQNLDVCPQDSDSLQHAMITAEDATTGSIVGFCEVAMLALPPCQQEECSSTAYAPTIVNLATSPKHRRQGIASSLLKSATQYVQRRWSSNEITLYVRSANKGAIALYGKHGFLPKGFSESRDAGELYMTKSLQTTTQRESVAM